MSSATSRHLRSSARWSALLTIGGYALIIFALGYAMVQLDEEPNEENVTVTATSIPPESSISPRPTADPDQSNETEIALAQAQDEIRVLQTQLAEFSRSPSDVTALQEEIATLRAENDVLSQRVAELSNPSNPIVN